jgi:hypothetical protein
MRRPKSAFLITTLVLAAAHPARADEAASPTSTPPSTSDRFQVPAPEELTTEPPSPSPPHRDPMTLPVVMEHPEDKPFLPSNDRTRFGLMGGIGFPRPVAISSFLQFDRSWSAGAELSVLPTTKIADVNLDFWAASAGARLHPWHGAFYVGLRGGYQHLSASGYLTQNGVTALAQGGIDTGFVNPELGFLWTFESGLALGFGAGVQIPLYSNVTSTSNLPVSADVLAAVGKLGTSTVPTVDLLRVGFVL